MNPPENPQISPNVTPVQEHLEGKRDLAWALGMCLIAVIIVRSFLFEPFKIPSSSMVPTLKIGDHIFVSKFSYGLSIPFTKFEFLKTGSPERGEVIVFLFPRDENLHYIKRVVGVPGDKLEFKGKDIYVNGELIPKEKVTDPNILSQMATGGEFSGELYKETLGNATHYVRYTRSTAYDFPNSRSEEVPPNHYFVVGDNRDDSYDSRAWGSVPRENIKGRARMVWLSLDQDQNWSKMGKIRWDRCGTLIH